MRKIINPVKCNVDGRYRKIDAFCEIVLENGRLSIRGVIGPRGNGSCIGSSGQCADEIRDGTPADGWTREMVDKFCDVWDNWHLNDMRAYCQHQKALGWDELAREKVTLYNYRLTRDASIKKRDAEAEALTALRKGLTFTPTQEQLLYASLPYSLKTEDEISGEKALYYEPKKPIFPGDEGPTETKALGWLRQEEHSEGILCKPCPVCGYKYGTKWLKEEVPEDVIDWLQKLPDTKIKPAWV